MIIEIAALKKRCNLASAVMVNGYPYLAARAISLGLVERGVADHDRRR
jgi:hypothetical protein